MAREQEFQLRDKSRAEVGFLMYLNGVKVLVNPNLSQATHNQGGITEANALGIAVTAEKIMIEGIRRAATHATPRQDYNKAFVYFRDMRTNRHIKDHIGIAIRELRIISKEIHDIEGLFMKPTYPELFEVWPAPMLERKIIVDVIDNHESELSATVLAPGMPVHPLFDQYVNLSYLELSEALDQG